MGERDPRRNAATRLGDHVGQGETGQMLAHVVAHLGPDAEQDALSFVVTGAVTVGLAKVTGDDRTIDGRHDLGQGDIAGVLGQNVATADAPLGAHEADALEAQQDLLEVRLGESSAFGEVANGHGGLEVVAQGEAQKGSAGVITSGGDLHGCQSTGGGFGPRGHVGAIFWHTSGVEEQHDTPITVDPTDVTSPSSESADVVEETDYISQPAKVMRLGAMVKTLLDEARSASLDEAGRARLADIYATTLTELSESLSKDLASELGRLSPPFAADVPSESELRIAQAQLVGWLEGLFHGIQASLFAQQAAAAQMEKSRERSLAPGESPRHGTYL